MENILVCEDETTIREFVVINLQRSGYNVVDVDCGERALEVYEQRNGNFDVILLDIMMPGIDGFEVCKRIREKDRNVGIIMLTAKTQEMDKVGGLMIGADDYVTKPFSPSELIARVDAICRRISVKGNKMQQEHTITSGPFVLNTRSRILTKDGEVIDLTQVEYQIMHLFLTNPLCALKRDEILKKIWGEEYGTDPKIVDVNIRRIRMKIEQEPSNPQFIKTIWGFGYKWEG